MRKSRAERERLGRRSLRARQPAAAGTGRGACPSVWAQVQILPLSHFSWMTLGELLISLYPGSSAAYHLRLFEASVR